MNNELNPYFENVNEDPQYQARKLLSESYWNGSLPVNLLDLCEVNDFPCQFIDDPRMDAPGTTKFYDDNTFCIFINTHGSDCLDGFSKQKSWLRRQRFTLAHEIGHCVYKSHNNIKLQQKLSAPSNPHAKSYRKWREAQANYFAANLLIPHESFKKWAHRKWGNIARLIEETADKFEVSIQVAIQQVARLSDYYCIALLFDKDGSLMRVPEYSSDFTETGLFYEKNQVAPEGTMAAQFLCGENLGLKGRRQHRDAAIWFPNAYAWKAEKYSIKETSFNLGSFGVASFLEIEEQDD